MSHNIQLSLYRSLPNSCIQTACSNCNSISLYSSMICSHSSFFFPCLSKQIPRWRVSPTCMKINHDFPICTEAKKSQHIKTIFELRKSGQVEFTSVGDFYDYCSIEIHLIFYSVELTWKNCIVLIKEIDLMVHKKKWWQTKPEQKRSLLFFLLFRNRLHSNISKLHDSWSLTFEMMSISRVDATQNESSRMEIGKTFTPQK